MTITWNIHRINARGNYGEIVNSCRDKDKAVRFACAQFTACKGNFVVTNNLVTVFDTRENYAEL